MLPSLSKLSIATILSREKHDNICTICYEPLFEATDPNIGPSTAMRKRRRNPDDNDELSILSNFGSVCALDCQEGHLIGGNLGRVYPDGCSGCLFLRL